MKGNGYHDGRKLHNMEDWHHYGDDGDNYAYYVHDLANVFARSVSCHSDEGGARVLRNSKQT